MEQNPHAAQARKTLHLRIVWFLVGAVVNYLLISTPFKFLREHYPNLNLFVISACSMGVSTVFFFLWNYFIGFRTDARKRDAFARYLTVVLILWALSSGLLTLFKHYNAHLKLSLGKFPLDLDVIATQACFGWLKFIIYHKWAFPVAKAPPAVEEAMGIKS